MTGNAVTPADVVDGDSSVASSRAAAPGATVAAASPMPNQSAPPTDYILPELSNSADSGSTPPIVQNGSGSSTGTVPSLSGTQSRTATPAATSASPETVSPERGPVPNPAVPRGSGVVLGVQALERQQAELERKRHSVTQTPQRVAATPQSTPAVPVQGRIEQAHSYRLENPFEDDETTEFSSMTGSELEVRPSGRGGSSSIGRLLRSTRKRLSSLDRNPAVAEGESSDDSDDEFHDDSSRPIIYGYLQKLGRNGKWQTRFFETDGECLTYYKSEKRNHLLATLDLMKVGDISMDTSDPTSCTFRIQVADRPYSLRAENSATCKDWVITLNRTKEARMHIGNVELVTPKFHDPPDLLDRNRTESEEYAARVVVNANRKRTRAVDESVNSWNQLVDKREKPPDFLSNSPVSITKPSVSPERPPKRMIAHLPPKVLARWEKRQSVLHRVGRRLARWARRARCTGDVNDVQLDRRVHPPGHLDSTTSSSYPTKTTKSRSRDSSEGAESGASVGSGSLSSAHRHNDNMSHTEWIGKEAQLSSQPVSPKAVETESEQEARELS